MTKTIKMSAESIISIHNAGRSSCVNGILRDLAGHISGPFGAGETVAYAESARPDITISAWVEPISQDDEDLNERDYRISADIEVLGRRIKFRMPAGKAESAAAAASRSRDALREGLMTAIAQIPAEAREIVKHTAYRIAA